MAESRYGKYITTELKRGIVIPGGKGSRQIAQGYRDGCRLGLEHIIWTDGEVIPGAYYGEYAWRWPSTMKDQRQMAGMPVPELVTPEMVKSGKVPGIVPHSHPFVEIFGCLGTNVDDPSDLGGEIEFWLEDEKFLLTRSFMVYIPANMKHGPLIIRRLDAPMFQMALGSSEKCI